MTIYIYYITQYGFINIISDNHIKSLTPDQNYKLYGGIKYLNLELNFLKP